MKKILIILIFTLMFSCSGNKENSAGNMLLSIWQENEIGDVKWGYINSSGEIIIEPAYEEAFSENKDGLLAVRLNGMWGFINKEGETVIDFKYNEAPVFYNGLAKVNNAGLCGFIDTTGTLVIDTVFEDAKVFIDKNYATVKYNGSWGMIDNTGEVVIEPVYDDLKNLSEGLIGFKLDGRYGFINLQGNIVIEPQFDDAGYFKNNLAPVKTGAKWGFIDNTGKFVIEPIFEYASPAEDNMLYPVMLANKWGYINNKAELVINPIYDEVQVFLNGIAYVKKGSLEGYITTSNEVIWNSSESFFYLNDIPDDVKNQLIFTIQDQNAELIRIIKARKVEVNINTNIWLVEVLLNIDNSEKYEWIEIEL